MFSGVKILSEFQRQIAVIDWLAFKNVTSGTVVLDLLKLTLLAVVFMVTEQSICDWDLF